MANWNERRGHRGHGPDDAREDIHQGPWSPYNGRARDDERDTWGSRGRDYWIEDDRWEDRRMGMGDQWRHRDDDQDREDNDAQWGNRMGLREEPIERSIPRSGAWDREPRYGEMERMWSDRDDHPWPDERRATDEERRAHRDYAHSRYADSHYADRRYADRRYADSRYADRRYADSRYADSRYADREHDDDYARERGGEQYPTNARNWTERRDRGEPWRYDDRHHEQRLTDEERFGHQDPEWVQRSYQRGPDDRYRRDDRSREHRDDYRDPRMMQRRDMRGHDDRHRDDREQRGDRRGDPHGDDRSGARFGGQRRHRNRYD